MSTFNTGAGIRPTVLNSSWKFRRRQDAASGTARSPVPQLLQPGACAFPASVFNLALEEIEAITKDAGVPANAASVDAACRALGKAVRSAQAGGLGGRRLSYVAARANAVIENIVMRMPHLAGAVSLVAVDGQALSFRSAGFCKAMDEILMLVRGTLPPYDTGECRRALTKILEECGSTPDVRKDELSALLGATDALTALGFKMSRGDGMIYAKKFDLGYCPGDGPDSIPEERQELLALLAKPVSSIEEASCLASAIKKNLLEVLKGAMLGGASARQIDELLQAVDSWFAANGGFEGGPVASDPAALLDGLSPAAIGALQDAGVRNAQGYPKPTAAELFASPARLW